MQAALGGGQGVDEGHHQSDEAADADDDGAPEDVDAGQPGDEGTDQEGAAPAGQRRDARDGDGRTTGQVVEGGAEDDGADGEEQEVDDGVGHDFSWEVGTSAAAEVRWLYRRRRA